MGPVLVQNGRPIAFTSRTLTTSERNHSTTEKECLAIVWAIGTFHPYVHGAILTIYTDHMALNSILSTKASKSRIARWIMLLQTYDGTVLDRKGVYNQDADALNRLQITNTPDASKLTLETLKMAQKDDSFTKKIIESGVQPPFLLRDGILCRGDPPVIVMSKSLYQATLQALHDHPTAGHFGRDKTIKRAREICWWPMIDQEVADYVKSSDKCQRFKAANSKVGELRSITRNFVGEIWAADIAILPESQRGNKYLFVIMEYLTRWAITVPLLVMDSEILKIAAPLYEVVLKFGTPGRIITDNGTNLTSYVMENLTKKRQIRHAKTSVEHPQTDGLVERLNRTIKTSLTAYVEMDPTSWDDKLPFVTFAYNTSVQKKYQEAPI